MIVIKLQGAVSSLCFQFMVKIVQYIRTFRIESCKLLYLVSPQCRVIHDISSYCFHCGISPRLKKDEGRPQR